MNTRDALFAAIDWLEANPNKHITGAIARDAYGCRVNPCAPEAECFCILGRFAREAELPMLDAYDWITLRKAIEPLGMGVHGLYSINDRRAPKDKVCAELRAYVRRYIREA